MTSLPCDVIAALQGRTLVTAESCTGGAIGAALTSVSGSSAVYKGGAVTYCNALKHKMLGVPEELLSSCGAVSALVAEAMATGARLSLDSDIAVSVTGLAGPGGDDYGNPVGTVYIGYADNCICVSRKYLFSGDRNAVRAQAVEEALKLVLELCRGVQGQKNS